MTRYEEDLQNTTIINALYYNKSEQLSSL